MNWFSNTCNGLFREQTRRGFTLLEVLIGMTILTAGILSIAAIYPYLLRANNDAELLTIGAALAQMKAEEVRRDDSRYDGLGRLKTEIRLLPAPSQPVIFPQDPRLAYSFYGQSLLYSDPADPRGAPNVPRVIIRYSPVYRDSQDVIYELRFN